MQLSADKEQMEAILNVPSPDGLLPIHHAAFSDFWPLVDLLLDSGHSGVGVDWAGRNILHYAAIKGRADATRSLLAKLPESAANAKEGNGQSPLRLAIGNVSRY